MVPPLPAFRVACRLPDVCRSFSPMAEVHGWGLLLSYSKISSEYSNGNVPDQQGATVGILERPGRAVRWRRRVVTAVGEGVLLRSPRTGAEVWMV